MKSLRGVFFLLLLLACLGTTACTAGLFPTFGRINPNDEATRAFDDCTVNTDFRYYVSGPDDHPNVIVGLHRDYRFDTQGLWKEVEMTPAVMKNIVSSMKEKSSTRQRYLYGFELVTPDGRPIGVWYSIPTARTCMEMKKDGMVRLDTPDLDTFHELNGDTGVYMESG
ncbi:MAG: hypothetical protein LLG97_13120 [Deltaproteobacteria bacterium]|nr:hypothetical protein [Deltaproteobacteria bacterium]